VVYRKTVSFITAIWNVLLVAGSIIFILSGTDKLTWAGYLIALYLGHRITHFNSSSEKLDHPMANEKINAADYLSRQARSALVQAANKANLFGGSFLLYLAKELIDKKEAREAFIRLDVDYDQFKAKLEEHLNASMSQIKEDYKAINLSIETLSVGAIEMSLANHNQEIRAADLLAALAGFKESQDMSKLFGLFEISSDDLERALIFGRFSRNLWARKLPTGLGGFVSQPYKLRHRIMNRAWTARPTPNLDRFSVDFTDMARAGATGLLVGHETEYQRMIDTLSRPNKPNALIIGEAGAGKEAIVGHLAYEIIRDRVPPPLFDKRLVAIDLNSLLAGADSAEQELRIKNIFEEINQAGNIILYLPDIHNLSRTAGRYELNIVNVIIPLILSNDFPTVGSTYPKDFKQFIDNQGSFADAFQFIDVNEISVSDAERVLTYDSLILEGRYKIKITYSAIKKSVEIAHKYFHQKLLPSSADDLLKEALAEATGRSAEVLTADDIIAVAEKRVNVPLRDAGEKEREKLLNLEVLIHEKLIDQEAAVSAVSKILREYRSGLSANKGPIGSFLFVGPTGVGKTELSKILAKIQFGSEAAMVRFDMSEYQDKSSFSRLIGSPDGEMSGALTEAILRKPFALVLLDEFEKAYPDVLNLFLQVFEDGRLTDNLSRVVDFKNTIIIATSNAESEFIKEAMDKGQKMEAITEELKKRLVRTFHPELLNRLQIIVFKSLSMDDLHAVAKLLFKEVEVSLNNQGIKFQITDEAIGKIAEIGYSPAFGARPLKSVIADKIKSPLSEMILRSEVQKGGGIKVTLEDNELNISIEKSEESRSS